MIGRRNRPALAGLGLAAALALTLAGCGNSEKEDVGVVNLPEPGAGTSAGSPAPANPAPAEGGTAAAPAKGAEAEAAPSGGATAEGWGTLKGRVVFGGSPPEVKPLVAKGDTTVKDANVCAVDAIPNQKLVVDPETKGVQFALVYIPRPTAVNKEAESEARSKPVGFDQKGCMFIPHVIAAIEKATITLKSSDPLGHNINSKVANNAFNQGIQPNQSITKPARSSGRPGEVVCDIHPWMKSYWYISKNPYFAVTDAKGNFEIKNVPAGNQKVVVWSEAVLPDFVTAATGDSVEIKADGETTKDFTIDPSKVKL